MAFCELCERCFFFNERLLDILLSNSEDLRGKYCVVHFTECAIYKLAKSCGIENVPGYVSPDDILLPHDNLPKGEMDMFLQVIYPDGTLGKVRASNLASMVQLARIVAYRCSEGWVETRRKINSPDYRGPERRAIIPFS